MPKPPDPLASAKRIMAAVVKMPPKPHAELKLGKAKGTAGTSPTKRKLVKKGSL